MVTTHHPGGSPALSYGRRISRLGRLVLTALGRENCGSGRGGGEEGRGGASRNLSWRGRPGTPGDRAGWRGAPYLVPPASLALTLQHRSGRGSQATLDPILSFPFLLIRSLKGSGIHLFFCT